MSDAQPRSYLVVVDATPESRLALRYAARRARQTGGHVRLLHVVRPTDFVQWGGVQAALESEAQEAAETLLAGIAAEIEAEVGLTPSTEIRVGKAAETVLAAITTGEPVSALVLGAAAKGAPGPLVAFFAGEGAGALPCPVVIVPGAMSEADLDRLA
jgi:nucleotide-binding universal stress UspA family protein